MATAIRMPQLSDTMSSGKILGWRKREGDIVARGDILAEVETDKANLEIEAFHAGVLLKIEVPEGIVAQVGQVIAQIGEAGEAIQSISAPVEPALAVAASTPLPASPQPRSVLAPLPSTPPLAAPLPSAAPHFSSVSPIASADPGRVKASPLARKIASERNLDLTAVQGSGPDGRIVRRDLDGAAARGPVAQRLDSPSASQSNLASTSIAPSNAAPALSESLTPLSKMRETIARRMQESVREIPLFYSTTSIRMNEVTKLRATLKENPEYQGVSINHFVLKAAGYALEREPRINAMLRDNAVFQPGQINIGIITALPDGLLIPVLREVNRLSFKAVVAEAKALVDRARSGRPTSQDLSGGTFSISNMGMLDLDSFTAIVNPGQGAILAVGSIKEEPVVQNEQIMIGQVLRVTLSVDHRIIDGVMAGTFLKYFKEALETPALLFI